MADTLNPQQRSERMALIRSTDTAPELMVRKMVHAMGYRYRLHDKRLPGAPDMVFGRLGKIIFVHGCFWHRHKKRSCRLARLPKSRIAFWEEKLEGNRRRDLSNKRLLRRAGWAVIEVWECELKNLETLRARLRYFLEDEVN
jgi:DNA mismatch endonuclease (patch repair protein)